MRAWNELLTISDTWPVLLNSTVIVKVEKLAPIQRGGGGGPAWWLVKPTLDGKRGRQYWLVLWKLTNSIDKNRKHNFLCQFWCRISGWGLAPWWLQRSPTYYAENHTQKYIIAETQSLLKQKVTDMSDPPLSSQCWWRILWTVHWIFFFEYRVSN